MAYTRTHVLGNQIPPYATGQLNDYSDVVELEQQNSASLEAIDKFCGYVSSSIVEFNFSGILGRRLDLEADGGFRGGRYHALNNRVIESVGVQCNYNDGSDVARFNIQTFSTSSSGELFTDIFNGKASPLKPHLSAALGEDYVTRWYTPVASSASWIAGATLYAQIVSGTITSADLGTVTLYVRYRHSGSYGDNGLI